MSKRFVCVGCVYVYVFYCCQYGGGGVCVCETRIYRLKKYFRMQSSKCTHARGGGGGGGGGIAQWLLCRTRD